MLFDMVPSCGPVSISQKSWDELRDAAENEDVSSLCRNDIVTEMNVYLKQATEL